VESEGLSSARSQRNGASRTRLSGGRARGEGVRHLGRDIHYPRVAQGGRISGRYSSARLSGSPWPASMRVVFPFAKARDDFMVSARSLSLSLSLLSRPKPHHHFQGSFVAEINSPLMPLMYRRGARRARYYGGINGKLIAGSCTHCDNCGWRKRMRRATLLIRINKRAGAPRGSASPLPRSLVERVGWKKLTAAAAKTVRARVE